MDPAKRFPGTDSRIRFRSRPDGGMTVEFADDTPSIEFSKEDAVELIRILGESDEAKDIAANLGEIIGLPY